MKAFWLPAPEFPFFFFFFCSLQIRRNETRQRYCVFLILELFLVVTTHCQSVCHSHCHRLPYTSARERTNARTKRIERNIRRTDARSSFPRDSGGCRRMLHWTRKCVAAKMRSSRRSRRRRNELRWNRISSEWRHPRIRGACGFGVSLERKFTPLSGLNFALIWSPIPVFNEHSASLAECHVTGNCRRIELLDWTKSIVNLPIHSGPTPLTSLFSLFYGKSDNLTAAAF
jgi:hypothetical protein